MSIVAGKIGVQAGTHLLHQPMGGKGKLLGGLPSTERGNVVVFGAGKAGGASAALAASAGANVTVFEMRQDRMDEMMRLGHNVTRSEEHTSELQSLMRISYAVFCFQKKKHTKN